MDGLPAYMAAIDAAEAKHERAVMDLDNAARNLQRSTPDRLFAHRIRYLRCRIIVARSACAVARAYMGA